jgi:molybdopterin synthase catalytic subunit/molybdopterin converting factor small subunit
LADERVTTVRVLLFGPLREAAGWNEREARGATVEEVWREVCRDAPRLADHRESVRPAVDMAYGAWADVLTDGATVAFIPPVAGGSGDDVITDAVLTRDPVDVSALLERVQRGGDGAVDLFLGMVRDHSDGVAVSQLDYEAYEPMALSMMRSKAAAVAQRSGVSALVVIHRLGELRVGDIAIAVAAAAPHRAEAFAACRALVDDVKSDVPIFKREHTPRDVRWVDARCAHREAG